jgi:heme A synthase
MLVCAFIFLAWAYIMLVGAYLHFRGSPRGCVEWRIPACFGLAFLVLACAFFYCG